MLFNYLPTYNYKGLADKIYGNSKFPENTVIVVLDDDPTGTQTVQNVSVYTDWEENTILKAFESEKKVFFILTNSRSMSAEESKRIHREIGERIKNASIKTNKNFTIISRGDSTLRGHYPMETEALAESLGGDYDGEIFIPFFEEGGRYTFENTHYVKQGNYLIPAGETEFAKDSTFGYKSSDLKEYIEEKTNGKIRKNDVISIPVELLNEAEVEEIIKMLLSAENNRKIIVNAVEYDDLKIFYYCFTQALKKGKKFIVRSAASWIKICGKFENQPVLEKENFVFDSQYGGLVVVGSHVTKTTKQLENLKASEIPIEYVLFKYNKYADLSAEATITAYKISSLLYEGKNVCLYTPRNDLYDVDMTEEEKLEFSVKIAKIITSVVEHLMVKPKFIISKGGITSADIAKNGLKIKRAWAVGQILPGVPVWATGGESKFPGIPYVIFPGNVGNESGLTDVVRKLV